MDGLQIYFDDSTGVAKVYDDTYDITIHCENEEEQEKAKRIMRRLSDNGPDDFREGELVVYQNGDSFEVGRIKRLAENVAFVHYHEGDTAAATPYDHLHKILNAYVIKDILWRCD